MNRVLPLILLGTACSDYDLLAKELAEGIAEDTAVSDEEIDASTDTSTPEDTSEPPVEDPNRPVAVCDVSPNPVQPPFESATWDGSASYDPSGDPLMSYNWTLVSQPEGSSVTFTNSAASVISTFLPHPARDHPERSEEEQGHREQHAAQGLRSRVAPEARRSTWHSHFFFSLALGLRHYYLSSVFVLYPAGIAFVHTF